MKTQIKILLITFCTVFMQNAANANVEKTLTRTFAATSEYTLYVDSRHGHVNIRNWDRNEISIDVSIDIENRDLMSKIDVELSESGKTVRAKTVLPSDFNCNNCKLKIIYEISVPKGVSFDLHNKFGNIDMGDVDGDAKIEVQFGSLKAGNFSRPGRIEIAYGNVDAGNFSGKINAQFSDVKIASADELKISGGYNSSIDIKEAKTLKPDLKYDNLRIDKVDVFEGNMSFSNVKIGTLNTSCFGRIKFGDFKVDYLAPDFSTVDIEGDFASIKFMKVKNNGKGWDSYFENTSFKDGVVSSSGKKSSFKIKNNDAKVKP